MGPQSTEPRPPARQRRTGRLEPYLFLVLEGARLEAGGLRIALAGAAGLRIGRGEARTLHAGDEGWLALEVPDARMSGSHARIVRTGAALAVEDCGSTNGTLVNGEAVERHALGDGDLVELGQTTFLYREIDDEVARGAPSLDAAAITAVPGFATLDPGLARRLERLARVAPSPLAILLLGETGTGKEVVARGVHALSQRPGPFVAVNCGAIPHDLVESHLFGHVRGAFSGALRDEPGVVRSAQHGTLLLDEIGDLPPGSQAALLRVLQESEVQPVGSAHTIGVDVRVIAATHVPLDDVIERGGFRRDLYARLAGYRFALPALRDRRVDLGLLIAALLAAGKLGDGGLRLDDEAARALVRHDWPMNVRELAQCLASARMLADDGVVTADELPPAVAAQLQPGAPHDTDTGTALAGSPGDGAARADPARPPREAHRAQIVTLLAEHDGNLSAVARALRTSRSQLRRLMERYGITGA